MKYIECPKCGGFKVDTSWHYDAKLYTCNACGYKNNDFAFTPRPEPAR